MTARLNFPFETLLQPTTMMLLKQLLLVFASLGCALSMDISRCPADWPEFRGPAGDGIADGNLPVNWSPKSNIEWRTELPGQGWSSPVAVGEVIYLTAAVPNQANREDQPQRIDEPEKPVAENGYRLVLLMLRADSGELFKQVELFEQPDDAPRIHRKNSHASPTPMLHAGRLYLHFGHQGTACCTLDGDVVWRNSDLAYPPVHGNGGSPVIADQWMVFSRDGADISQVTAVDKRSGELGWTSERQTNASKLFSFCTPLLIEHQGVQQLIIPGSDVVQSLNPANGQEIWRAAYSGYSVVPRPIYYQGLVYICTGYDRPKLLAIDPSGHGNVTESHIRWSVDAAVPKTPSLIGWQSKIIMVSDNGLCTCLDAETGSTEWKIRLGGDYSASPILNDGKLYAVSEAGVCTVLDVSSSQPSVLATNDLQERTLASPAVKDDSLLIRTANALYRISE
jgi:outer membrane protein assembly factor BamB